MREDLIERMEKASGPDRELDRDICRATMDGRFKESFDYAKDWPHYTASIDAALTLVPEGWCWDIAFDNYPLASVGNFSSGKVATPALALTAAALKAIHHLKSRSAQAGDV